MIEFLRIRCIFSLSRVFKICSPARRESVATSQWDKQGTQAPWKHEVHMENIHRPEYSEILSFSLAHNELLLLLHLLPCLLQLQLDGGHQLFPRLHHHLAQLLLLLLNLGRETLSSWQAKFTCRCTNSSLSFASCCQRTRPAPRPHLRSNWRRKNIKLSVLSCILKVSTAKNNFPHIRQLNCSKMSSCCRSSTCARGRTSSQYLPTRFNATQNLHASWTRNKFCCYPGTDINTLSIPLPPWTSASPPPPSSPADAGPQAAACISQPAPNHFTSYGTIPNVVPSEPFLVS